VGRATQRVEITRTVEEDILAIRERIARDKPRAADAWLRAVRRQLPASARGRLIVADPARAADTINGP
jgi:hypothetical protein